MTFSSMHTKMKLSPPKFIKPSDYENWRSRFQDYLALLDPALLTCLTTKNVNNDDLILERKAYDVLKLGLPGDVLKILSNKKTTCELWEAVGKKYGREDEIKKSSDDGITEKLLKKDEEIQALQSQILNMENEREKMRLTIVGLEKKVAEFEDQQTAMNKLQVDHDLAVKMVDALREQCDKVSQSQTPPVKEKKKKKKIYTDKSSEPLVRMVRTKRMSQFTTYSLQKNKNKKYSENSPITKQRVHHTVDRCVYTRAQMFALAPSCCDHMVQRRRKDYVPFSLREYWLPPVPRIEFRHETTRFNFRWNSISLDYLDASYKRLSKISRKIGTVLKWVPKAVV